MSSEQSTVTKSGVAPADGGDLSVVEGGEAEDDLIGRTLSERYLIEGCLGRGGMGTVYQAEHTLMKKKVAIKVLHEDVIGHGEAVERFRREAQAAAHIDHQNVCVATDFGEMGEGGFFLVMEYLEGNTLDERLVCVERFEPPRAIHIARQICGALAQAHRLGVVHRDLKPENVMLVHRGDDPDFVKIMDFGVARVRIGGEADSSKITQAGRIYGTPHYMAPEQAAGSEKIDHRADLYSLGVMLFEMLTGSLPFADESPTRVMAMHMTREPPSIRKQASEANLPRSLDRLIRSLMAKEPDDRPSSAADVRDELDAILDAQQTKSESIVARTRKLAVTGTDALRAASRQVAPHLESVQSLAKHAQSRLADRWTPRQLAMGTAALGFFVVVAAFALSAVGPSGPAIEEEARAEQAAVLAEEREELGVDEVIGALDEGDAAAALEQLDSLAEEEGDSPHLTYLRGRALAEDDQLTEALEAYDEALEAEPLYASDERLVDDLLTILSGGDDEEAERAEQLLLERLPEPVANERLSKLARLGDSGAVRKRARQTLEESGRFENLEAWNRASIELRFAHGCDEHREKIDAIVEAGDARGLEVLRFYDELPRSGCGSFNNEDCYGCIRDDLAEAIEELERLEKND